MKERWRTITDAKKVMNEAPGVFNGVLTLPPLIEVIQGEFDINGKGAKLGGGIASASEALANSERPDERGQP